MLRLAAHPAQGVRAGSPMVLAWPAQALADADRAGPAAHPCDQDGAADPAVVFARAARHGRAVGAVLSVPRGARCAVQRPEAACVPEVVQPVEGRPAAGSSDARLPAAELSVSGQAAERPVGVEPAAQAGLQRVAGAQVARQAAARALRRAADPWVRALRAAFWDRRPALAPERAAAVRNAALPSRFDRGSGQARPHRPGEWL